MKQLYLFGAPVKIRRRRKTSRHRRESGASLAPHNPPTWRELAQAWITKHPEAMALFAELAEVASRRRRKVGIGLLTELIRWHYEIEKDAGDFKINNNYRAEIARELVRRHPHLAGTITFRQTEDEAGVGLVVPPKGGA